MVPRKIVETKTCFWACQWVVLHCYDMTNINHLELLLAEGLLHYQVRTNIIILFGIHQSKCPRVSIAKNDEQTENEGAKMNDMYVPDRFNAHKVSYRCK